LRMARVLSAALADVHAFIFHTRIAAVSEALRDPDPWQSQERLLLLAEGWGGGTRIGECLHEVNERGAPRRRASGSGGRVVSDGYDTGEPARLAAGLEALGARARRLIWLNPLLGQPGFAPVSRGMQAALPRVDLLAPGGNLAAIERVLPDLLEVLR